MWPSGDTSRGSEDYFGLDLALCRRILVLPFKTLGQTDALPVELVDLAVMGEPVQQGCRQGSIAKDLSPFGKGQVWRVV